MCSPPPRMASLAEIMASLADQEKRVQVAKTVIYESLNLGLPQSPHARTFCHLNHPSGVAVEGSERATRVQQGLCRPHPQSKNG